MREGEGEGKEASDPKYSEVSWYLFLYGMDLY